MWLEMLCECCWWREIRLLAQMSPDKTCLSAVETNSSLVAENSDRLTWLTTGTVDSSSMSEHGETDGKIKELVSVNHRGITGEHEFTGLKRLNPPHMLDMILVDMNGTLLN